MMDRKLWQYPAKTQPVQEVALPTLDWLVQHPDPVRPLERLVPGEATLVEEFVAPPVVPDIGWLVQQPDPVRRLPELVGEQLAFTRLVELSEIPIDWAVEHPDPVRRPPELVHEQLAFTRLVELSEIPIDWLVQHPDPRRRPPELVSEGQFSFLRLVELSEITIDWLVQQPDPILPLPQPPTGAVLVEFGVPIPPAIPDIDFIVQHPGPLPKPPPTQTEPILAFEHEDLIPAPDWLVQHPDPVRPSERLVPEAFVFEFEHELLIPSIDWWQQQLDPIRPEETRQDYYARDLTIPEVLLGQWWQPASQPVRLPIQLVRFHGELFLVEFAVPPGVLIPYAFRECIALWQMIRPMRGDWAPLPSGYRASPIDIPVPSGYTKKLDGGALWDFE